MTSCDGRYVIIYNGEVYNYKALKAELVEAGRVFTTDSDTEVVLEAFAEWGSAAFDRFNGMWGLAIYDRVNESLTLSRDHFGIKPLYYSRVGDGLIFSSELKPMLDSGFVPRVPNDKIIYRYLNFRVHDNTSETFFAHIEKLMPGEMLTIDTSGIRVEAFSHLRDELAALAANDAPYDAAATARYREELTESVRLRLQSDVSVGTALSGGLDSSTVAVLIGQLMHRDAASTTAIGPKQNVFSAIFPGSINDEEVFIDAASKAIGDELIVHKIKPAPDEFSKDILEFIRVQEEPIISSGPYAQYKLMQEASRHVTVLLDGQGADETMAGYVPYYAVYLMSLKNQKRYLKMIAEGFACLDVMLRLVRFRLFDKLRGRKTIAPKTLMSDQFLAEYQDERFTIIRDNLKMRLLEDVFENSIPVLLRYEDKNTSRFSLEGRIPFLDKELLKYLFSLSDEAIIKAGWNKRILRDSMTGFLPDLIAKRRNKVGFTTPELEWFMRLKDYFYEVLSSESFGRRKYFKQSEVVKAYEGFMNGKVSTDTLLFWRFINIELWMREFIDESTEPVVSATSG